jgi:hypothetical protein
MPTNSLQMAYYSRLFYKTRYKKTLQKCRVHQFCLNLERKLLLHDFLYLIFRNNFFFESISSSRFRLDGSYYFGVFYSTFFFQGCNYFLCHNYLISLWTVCFLIIGLYFFNSNLSVVFFRFFIEIYLEVPGKPDSLCSVHSKITCTLFPFFAMIQTNLYVNTVFSSIFQNRRNSFLINGF